MTDLFHRLNLATKTSLKPVKGISLFANVGISETYLASQNIHIVAANELLPERAKFYQHLHQHSQMICGDIADEKIFRQLVAKFHSEKCSFLIATPPCQGMSIAGKMNKDDPRNKLIINVIDFIKETEPENIIIENVANILNFAITYQEKPIKIVDFIKEQLIPLKYFINYAVLDASDYDTPQYRKRAIFLISKHKMWHFPAKKPKITVLDAIGDLPSLESGQDSSIKYHFAKTHNQQHILWMQHTPTGKTALENEVFFPQKNNRKIKGFATTYKRIKWHEPAPTITMCNGAISSQNNVHPGRQINENQYSDARVLSILELLRLTGLPDDWNIPNWASDNLIRQVLGESFPPKFCLNLITTMPKK